MTPEGDLKREIREYLKAKGVYRINVPGGGYGDVGAPDIVACYKGRFIGIEAKVGRNTMSAWQKRHMKGILDAGGIHIEARSLKDVQDVIESLDE